MGHGGELYGERRVESMVERGTSDVRSLFGVLAFWCATFYIYRRLSGEDLDAAAGLAETFSEVKSNFDF